MIRSFFIGVLSLALLSEANCSGMSYTGNNNNDPDFEVAQAPQSIPNSKSDLNELMPAEIESYLFDQGKRVLDDVIAGRGFDSRNSTIFEGLKLDTYHREIRFANPALGGLSTLARWALSSADVEYNTKRKNHLAAIVATCWYLKKLAAHKGELFERGSFTLVDPEHRYLNFLLDYVTLVTGSTDPASQSYFKTLSNFAYRRDPAKGGSSHHVDRSPEAQFGIDVRYEPHDSVLMMLPFKKTHILFGKLDAGQSAPLTFLKLEEMGMGSTTAVVLHSMNFLNSHGPVGMNARREKDIPDALKLAFRDLMPLIDCQSEPDTIRKMWLHIIKYNRSHNNVNDEIGDKIALFCELLDNTYPDRIHHLRVGNEVILDLASADILTQNLTPIGSPLDDVKPSQIL
jgi:hypothetical protein